MGRPTKVALALAGGGFTGYLFEIGALTALDDLFDDGFSVNDFDLYVGVSAGAAAASLVANRVPPGDILETNLSGQRPYYFEHRDIFSPAIGEGLKTVWRAARQLIPLLEFYAHHYQEMTLIDLLDKAQDALPSGIYTLEPFAKYLETTFTSRGLSNQFTGLAKELYIPAIDLETGASVMFGDEGWREVPISRAVAASSAAPIYFCPVRIKGRDYIDAGIGRLAFFDIAHNKGVDFMIMINPMLRTPRGGQTHGKGAVGASAGRLRDKGLLSIGEQASRINFEVRFSQALTLFQQGHPDTELLMMTPAPHNASLFERSFLTYHDRVLLLRAGYLSVVSSVSDRFDELLAQLARHGISVSQTRFEDRIKRRMAQFDEVAAASGRLRFPATAVSDGVVPTDMAWRKAHQRQGSG